MRYETYWEAIRDSSFKVGDLVGLGSGVMVDSGL